MTRLSIVLDRDLKIVRFVACVLVIAPEVEIDARCRDTGSGQAPVDGISFEMIPTPLVRECQIGFPVMSVSKGMRASGKFSRTGLPDSQSSGQVHHQTADAEIARSHSAAGAESMMFRIFSRSLNVNQNGVIVPCRDMTCRTQTMCEAIRCNRTSGRELSVHARDFEAEQLLRRHHIGEVVAERIEIIHPVGDHDALLIFFVFEELLHPLWR